MATSRSRVMLGAVVVGTILVGGSGLSLARSAGDSIAAFVKIGSGSAAEVAVHVQSIAIHASILAGLLANGTSIDDGAGKTRAKPEIWRSWNGFKAVAATQETAATSPDAGPSPVRISWRTG